jgi:transcription factor SPN1
MFLSKSDEETTANRKLAKELVDKWVSLFSVSIFVFVFGCCEGFLLVTCKKNQSRPIFNKSTRFEDMKRYDDERAPYRRPQMKK